jgi:7-keto-8-aminopelargonate synthetase-like enzyme
MESALGPRLSSTGSAASLFRGTGTSPCTATRRSSRRASPPSASSAVTAPRRDGLRQHARSDRARAADRGFFGTEDSIHFVSGYLDNLFLVQALKDKVGAIFIDETAHFSIRDAVYSALKPVYTYKHRDPEDLARQLKSKLKAGDVPLIMSDGIFPTFGVIAPVPEYLKVIEPYNGYLCLDDSHAVGHLGPNGRGTYDYFGVKSDRCFYAGTMSKAFGGHGGFIPASKAFIDHIKATCGAYPGATPSPTPAMAASTKGLEIVKREPQRRERLRRNVARVKTGMKKLATT